MLTRKQLELLVYIDHYLAQTGCAPSFDEMAVAMNLASKSGVHRLILALEERGFIARSPKRVRALKVLQVPARRLALLSPAPVVPTASNAAEDGLLVPVRARDNADNSVTMLSPDIPDSLSSLQALEMVKDALQDHGRIKILQHPEVGKLFINLAKLLNAYGLAPAEAALAAAQSDAGNTARKVSQEPHTAETIDSPRNVSQKILVVDDATDVLVTTEAFLGSAGFVVLTATSGDEALRLIAHNPAIGILVTDFAMPGLSGIDLISQAQQMRPDLSVRPESY